MSDGWVYDEPSLRDFISMVLVHAPDEFPVEDYLEHDQQLNLDRAFAELRRGLSFVERLNADAAALATAEGLIRRAYEQYGAGQLPEATKTMQSLESCLGFEITSDDDGAMIPKLVSAALDGPTYTRQDLSRVTTALRDLRCEALLDFAQFYRSYEGPFGSTSSGWELLDLVEGTPNVLKQTQTAREIHRFAEHHIVLTELLGNAVLVLDSVTGEVYNVDFEGGDAELRRGTLKPRWYSFAAFLEAFFNEPAAR